MTDLASVLVNPAQAEIARAIKEGADALDVKTFAHDRSKFMNASEAGRCIRYQWFSKHTPADSAPQEWGFARRGQAIENWVIERLQAAGVDVLYAGDNQVSFTDTTRHIAGTPDGIYFTHIFGSPMSAILEIKSIDGFTKKESLPKPEHELQVKINLLLCNEALAKDAGKLTRTANGEEAHYPLTFGTLIYVNASNYNDITEYCVAPFTDEEIARMEARASKILRSKSVDRLDREGKVRHNGRECRYCSFAMPCGVNVSEFADSAGSAQKRAYAGSHIDETAKRYVEIQNTEKECSAEKKELREIIVNELRSRGVSELMIGNSIKITLSSVAGRRSFDENAATAAGLDVSPYYKVGKPSDRLLVEDITTAETPA